MLGVAFSGLTQLLSPARAGAAMGVVVGSLLARTGAVRMMRHILVPIPTSAPAHAAMSGKRRHTGGNGGGNGSGHGNGGVSDEEAPTEDGAKGQHPQQRRELQHQQQPLVLPFKAFCICFCVTTLILTALVIGKQNIPALQKPLPPGVVLPSQPVWPEK